VFGSGDPADRELDESFVPKTRALVTTAVAISNQSAQPNAANHEDSG
jgi:hypothetical protein